MFESFIDFAKMITGSELVAPQLTFGHLCVRVLIVFIVGFLVARLNHRLTGRTTSFDFIMRVIIGTLLATAIVGSPFFPIIAIVPLIVLANILLALAASYHSTVEYVIKGPTPVLVEEGEIKWHIMRYNYISKEDLMEAVRENNIQHIHEVKRAVLEKDGKISILTYQ
jgi:uncharacterized membrane protein YcaP (DUF421 family)